MAKGPFANFLTKLSYVQQLFKEKDIQPIRTALVTSRNAPAHERAVKTLRNWGVSINEAFFLGGVSKTEVLAAFGAHIFFDDQDIHTEPASTVVPAATVPYRDGDNPKEEYTKIREDLRKYDAYLFFTPEYNRSLAPVLKNVIDIGSRDPKGNLWDGKVAAVFSASMGTSGGSMGNHALRESFIYVNLITMNQPEVYIAAVHTLFDEDGNLVKDTKTFLEDSTRAFVDFAKKHS